MADLSNYAEEALIKNLLCGTNFTPPATIYVGLHTGDPGETGASNEVSGGAYARQSAAFSYDADGVADNDSEILFPEATASWGTITHVSLWDAVTGGNCLMKGALTASQAIGIGNQFRFQAGELDGGLA